MPLTHVQLRKKFADFWIKNNHKEIPPIPLVPQNDPTTLFTGSGMQQLVPYLLVVLASMHTCHSLPV